MAFKANKIEVGKEISKKKSPSFDLKQFLLTKEEAIFIVKKLRESEYKGLEFQNYYHVMVKLEKILNSKDP